MEYAHIFVRFDCNEIALLVRNSRSSNPLAHHPQS